MTEKLEGAALIARERLRQVSQEGWSEYHDDGHDYDELAIAAACYALPDRKRESERRLAVLPMLWPWDFKFWKPTPDDRICELVKAGALIAAEIDRLQRLDSSQADESNEQADEMTITVTAQQLLNRGIWMEACTLLGINEWAIKEGLMDYSHKINMTESQARTLGIIQ